MLNTKCPRNGNSLQYYKIIYIIDRAWAHIHDLRAYNHDALAHRGYMSTSLVFEPIYTVKNLYNLYYMTTRRYISHKISWQRWVVQHHFSNKISVT